MLHELTENEYQIGINNINHLNAVLLNLLKEGKSEKVINVDNKCQALIRNIPASELEALSHSGNELFVPVKPLKEYLCGVAPRIDSSIAAVSRCFSTCQEWALGKHDREIRSLFGLGNDDIEFIRCAGQEDLDQVAFNVAYKLRSRHVFRYAGSPNNGAKRFHWLGVVSS